MGLDWSSGGNDFQKAMGTHDTSPAQQIDDPKGKQPAEADPSHLPVSDVNPHSTHSGDETIDTIDGKLMALRSYNLELVITRMQSKTRWIGIDSRINTTTLNSKTLLDDFLVIKSRIQSLKDKKVALTSKEAALTSYKRVEHQYREGNLSDTVKSWFQEVGFPFATNNQ